jgi:preprotein translocase subunit SecD
MTKINLTCHKCGFENTEESAFCSKCGSKLKRNEAKQNNKKNVVYVIVIAVLAIIILCLSYYIFFVVANQDETSDVFIDKIADTDIKEETEPKNEITTLKTDENIISEITTAAAANTEQQFIEEVQPEKILHAIFTADNSVNASDQELKDITQIFSTRLDLLGISGYSMEIDYDYDRVYVHIPLANENSNLDTEQILRDLGKTNELTFREGLDIDEYGKWQGVTETNIILTSEDILLASPEKYTDPSGEYWAVTIELTDEGKEKFAEATKRIALEKGIISIWIDDVVVSAPTVQSAITDGKIQISGSFDEQSATELANVLNAGVLPIELYISEFSIASID